MAMKMISRISAVGIAFMLVLAGVGCTDAASSSAPEADNASAMNDTSAAVVSADEHAVLITSSTGSPKCTGALMGQGYLVAFWTGCGGSSSPVRVGDRVIKAPSDGWQFPSRISNSDNYVTVRKVVQSTSSDGNSKVDVAYLSAKISCQESGIADEIDSATDYVDVIGYTNLTDDLAPSYDEVKATQKSVTDDDSYEGTFSVRNSGLFNAASGRNWEFGAIAKKTSEGRNHIAGVYYGLSGEYAKFARFDTCQSWLRAQMLEAKNSLNPPIVSSEQYICHDGYEYLCGDYCNLTGYGCDDEEFTFIEYGGEISVCDADNNCDEAIFQFNYAGHTYYCDAADNCAYEEAY
jgi:hypothetical protein